VLCSCCGHKIEGRAYPIEEGNKYVCERCWNNPDLFFPEKLQSDKRFKILKVIRENQTPTTTPLKIDVIRLQQKDIEMYLGKMRFMDILKLYEIERFKEKELSGYQRELYEERTAAFVNYIKKCPVPVVPSLLVSLREARFIAKNHDIGVLEIPRKKGAIWIIDGQHRIGGFEKLLESFVFDNVFSEIDYKTLLSLINFELPIVFVDLQRTLERLNNSKKLKQQLTYDDIERISFFVINKTQKGINPSLKDILMYKIKTGGVEGIPFLDKESWRVNATHISILLNEQENSPLYGKINLSGRRGTGKPIQLNSFVSSLKQLFTDKEFSRMNDYEQFAYLNAFWGILKELIPEAFHDIKWKDYMVLKVIGIYCLNWLALDVFKLCRKIGYNYKDKQVIEKIINPLRNFDWNRQTSPLSSLSGMKGVREGYTILHEFLDLKGNFVFNNSL